MTNDSTDQTWSTHVACGRRVATAVARASSLLQKAAMTVTGGLLLVGGPATAAFPESPTDVVRGTINEVIRILEDPRLKAPSQLIPRRRLLEEVIGSRFDYEEMSKRTLGAYWHRLSGTEQAEFVTLFKAFLSDRYASTIEGYSGEQVTYLAEQIEGAYAEVRTKLVSSKVEIPMDYRLIAKAGKWYAYDVIVDGVSLVKNYRSQFAGIIRSFSYAELVRRLRERSEAANR